MLSISFKFKICQKFKISQPKVIHCQLLTLTLSFSPNFKFKICQSSIDLNKSEFYIKARVSFSPNSKFKICQKFKLAKQKSPRWQLITIGWLILNF
jgi:hypothetical protein